MSPLETANLKTSAFMVRPDQIESVDEVKARRQKVTPERSISRSEIVRDALDLALPLIKADLDSPEDALEDASTAVPQSTRGP